MLKLLVVLPAFNEEEHIEEVIRGIPKRIEGISAIDVVVIDDGSKDNTVNVSAAAGVPVIQNPRHLGLGVTFERGLRYAIENNFDVMVNIDADGQFDPADIPTLVGPILNNKADFVTASRFIDKNYHPQMPWVRFIGNRLMSYLASRLTGRKFYDVSCGFRAYSRAAMLSLDLHGEFTYTHESFLNLVFKKLRVLEIPLKVKYFNHRRSKVASNLLTYGLNTARIYLKTYMNYKKLNSR